MTPLMHVRSEVWEPPVSLTLAFAFVAVVYMRGWFRLRPTSTDTIGVWHAAGFLLGLSLIWIAVASPLASSDMELLTVHMIQHLLLMSVAPALIWLGEPVRVLWGGLPPRVAQSMVAPAFQLWPIRRLGTLLGHPVVCWLAATATLVAWHVPSALTLGMQSPTWHAIEHTSFLAAGFLFWWPVIQPWPTSSTEPRWSIVVYLFLATLPCDILSGFLVFSERVAYPVYLSTPRHSSLSVLDDQQFAGALMWTAVTIIYLVAAMIVATRSLSGNRILATNPRTMEVA
jgi:putative membrane protein